MHDGQGIADAVYNNIFNKMEQMKVLIEENVGSS